MSEKVDNAILTSAFITLSSTAAADMLPDKYGGKGAKPSVRNLIAGMAAFTMLLVLAQFAPSFALAWAILIGVISFLYNAAPLLDSFIYAK